MARQQGGDHVVPVRREVFAQVADLGWRPGKAVEQQATPGTPAKAEGLELGGLGGGAPDRRRRTNGHAERSLTMTQVHRLGPGYMGGEGGPPWGARQWG